MWRLSTVLVLTQLGGCVSFSPRTWRPDQHMEVLAECRSACAGRMQEYEPYTGRCECAVPVFNKSY